MTEKRNLVSKLAEILGAVGNVPKQGRNAAQKYDYMRETDLVEKVRPMLAERRIMLILNTVEHERSEIRAGWSLTVITVEGTWYDGETGESLPAGRWIGYGADSGDKGVYKAMTGAEKYLLMKTFLVSTGDDPEADEKVDAAAAVAAAKATVTRSAQPAVQRGGRSGVATEAQIAAIGTAARELGFRVPDLRAYVQATLEVPVPEDAAALKAFMEDLTSGQAGQLVAGLREQLAAKAAAPVETVEQDTFSIV